MSQNDVERIKINKQPISIIGLKHVMEEMAIEYTQRPDDEVETELLNRLSGKNYIPDRARESYGNAFLREFKKFLGKSYDEEVSEGLEIKILGPGCPQCDKLHMEVMEVMAEMNLSADLNHVSDIKEIGEYGIMVTPALIIDGKVMSVGRIPTKGKIKEWLSEFM